MNHNARERDTNDSSGHELLIDTVDTLRYIVAFHRHLHGSHDFMPA
jgi:hypothetical protein